MKNLLLLFSLLTLSLSAHAFSADTVGVTIATPIDEEQIIIEPDSLWDSANTAYINGDYHKAAELYTSIVDRGLNSAQLYFNLGNAQYKLGDMARAILYYQKGLLYAPSDKDLAYNLAIAQSQIKDQIEEIPEFFAHRFVRSIGRTFDCTGWTIISLIALVALLAALLAFILASSIKMRKAGFGVAIFSALMLLISTLYALDERRELLDNNRAVVMSQSVSIKSSPDHSATELFMLHSGTTVTILRQIDQWFEITIADGKSGWIEGNRVEKI